MKVYIDHTWTKSEKDGLFAQRIKKRLVSISPKIEVVAFGDFKHPSDWEKPIELINESDIIIPIISEDYLSSVGYLEEALKKNIDGSKKYIFPVLFKPANWASYPWIVRTKILPESGIPFTELTESHSDELINELINRVKLVFHQIEQKEERRKEGDDIFGMVGDNQPFVFISHAYDDGDFAELLKLRIENSGIDCWLDTEKLNIGLDWKEEIDNGINNCIAVIVIMTPEAKKSEYVTYEWSYAIGKGKKIYPIMLKQTALHPKLESLQYLDFTNRNTRPFDKLLDSLKLIDANNSNKKRKSFFD